MTPNDLDPVMTVFGPFHRISDAYFARQDELWRAMIRKRYGWILDLGKATG